MEKQQITVGLPTTKPLQEIRNLDYELPVFHPGKTWEDLQAQIDTNDIDEKFARLMLPMPPNTAVEGEFMRLAGKDDAKYVVLKDSNANEFRIWLTGQLNYKFTRDVSPGDWVRVTYLGKSEEPIEITNEKGKLQKVYPHNFKLEAERAVSTH